MRSRSSTPRPSVRVVHRHQWLWEPLETDPTFVLRSMFGTKAAYLGGRMMLCFCARKDPWRGLLVCTDHDRQPALLADFSALSPHPILPKWLYLPESTPSFESDATRLVALARQCDPRLGIEPGSKTKSKRPKTTRGTTATPANPARPRRPRRPSRPRA